MRLAVLDIGTNTVLLLVAEADGMGIRRILDRHSIARLGEGVDRTKQISEAAYKRFITVLQEHLDVIREHRCDRIVAVATSAMRDAENRDEIVQRTKRDAGIEIQILTGDEEARWTYGGAIAGMNLPSTIGVLDIGGGSTELSFGFGNRFDRGKSVDIGAVRITERFAAIAEHRTEATEFIRTELGAWDVRGTSLQHFVAVAGTPTTLSAMHHHLKFFDVNTVHGDVLMRGEIGSLLDILFSITVKELVARYPAVDPARADILPAGTLILAEAMDLLGIASVTVSTQGLRYGIALREFFGGQE